MKAKSTVALDRAPADTVPSRRTDLMGDTELEHAVETLEKQPNPPPGGAKSGASAEGLPDSGAVSEIVEAWEHLPIEVRAALIAIVRSISTG
ncbi:MAG: hypothetical protein U1A27_03665 [Phycisphaerae bacterium]